MGQPSRILAFAGSSRRDSFNKKLIQNAATGAREAGAECTVVDLRHYPLPIYDGDLEAEQGLPENAAKLKTLLVDATALLIATPEYNGSVPALLKNTLDWTTRSPKATPDLSPYMGKVAGLLASSPGPLGGLRALTELRRQMANLGCVVLPQQVALRKAHEAFGEDGQIANDAHRAQAHDIGAQVANWAAKTSD
jgi:chromate reductase